jgi:plasmid stabilization system protein ParE
MSFSIVFRVEAQSEFDQAFDWYERQQSGLGSDFLNDVSDALERVVRFPESSAQIFEDVRRTVVRRFPYSILYRVEETQIVVIAIFHTKRNPKIWQERVS